VLVERKITKKTVSTSLPSVSLLGRFIMKVLLGVGERAFQIEIPSGSNNPILE
jgi:hypothetical protein